MNNAVDGPTGRARFAADLSAIVEHLRHSGAAVLVHTPLVDHHARWTDGFGDEPPTPWLDDPIHPGGRGQWEMARLTLQRLGLDDVGSELARLVL